MLVLSRRQGESIHIGKDIIIKVTKVWGGHARIAIQAPKDVIISRSELLSKEKEHATTCPEKEASPTEQTPNATEESQSE